MQDDAATPGSLHRYRSRCGFHLGIRQPNVLEAFIEPGRVGHRAFLSGDIEAEQASG
jgi:hypothetical protein